MRFLFALVPLLVSPSLPAADGYGMTFGDNTNASTGDGVVFVTCHGQPRTASGSCNAYTGDTACSTRLPVLCLDVDGRERPAGLLVPPQGGGVMPAPFYAGWAAGRVAATKPIAGVDLTGPSAADAICRTQFGKGWRMAEFHDGLIDDAGNRGGWAWYAHGTLDTTTRYWVWINDTQANCWNGTGQQIEAAPRVSGSGGVKRSTQKIARDRDE
ncbi:MAG TPA: hypothetical protein VLF18_19170 [Tahibacter sp.]|uniref:hypothetical protein n=1 Tax=Tahibacter sp. TaxID=2056211 RepID=UPI002C218646|nr:hypothetical protein [Tahibacter sp.]HSX62311.1 hypothetical protein [Tahibacter sp.]